MNVMQYKFVAQELQRRMQVIEDRNKNYEKSKAWQRYKRQEEQLYKKIEQLRKQEELENGNQPSC